MYAVITCLAAHDLRLVVVAGVICLVAAASSLGSYRRALVTTGPFRVVWLALFAFILGSGVWATHFLAILAYQQSLQMAFDLLGTALSLIIAVMGFGGGAWIAVRRQGPVGRALAGAWIGLSVGAMHYAGVLSMRLPATIEWRWDLVAASVVIGAGLGGWAFALARSLQTRRQFALGALLLTLAICGLHFTGMGAAILHPAPWTGEGGYGRHELTVAVVSAAALILLASSALLTIDRLSSLAAQAGLSESLRAVPTGIAFFDSQWRLLSWNPAYADILTDYGVSPRRGIGYADLVGEAQRSLDPSEVPATTVPSPADLPYKYDDLRTPAGGSRSSSARRAKAGSRRSSSTSPPSWPAARKRPNCAARPKRRTPPRVRSSPT